MESKLYLIKNRKLFFLQFLLISNILLLSTLQMFGYVPYLESAGFYIILINGILVFMIFIHLKKKLIHILLIPLFILTLVTYFLWNATMDYHYSYVKSPNQTETLIVKYRVTTLGESSYSFDFYQKAFLGLFMKKLEGQDYFTLIQASGDYTPPREVLGTEYAKWINEKEILFNTVTGEKKVFLK